MQMHGNSISIRTWTFINGWRGSRKPVPVRQEAGNEFVARRAWNSARNRAAARRTAAGLRAIGAAGCGSGSADCLERAVAAAAGATRAVAGRMEPVATVATKATLAQRATLGHAAAG